MAVWLRRQICAAVAVLALGALGSQGQVISRAAQNRPLFKNDAVEYLYPTQVSVAAGKASAVALHFRVAQGLHINSHAPSDEFLIPTVFSIPDGTGVRLSSAVYPAGTQMALAADPTTKLSVYTGEFTIPVRIVATPGNHRVQGKLRYQACDRNQCLPPTTIDVAIDVIAK